MTDYTENPEESLEPAATEEVAPLAEAVELPAPVEEVVPLEEPAPKLKKHADPVPVTLDDINSSLPTPAGPAVVSNAERDIVKASAIVYKNEVARKSLSVHHLQRRLVELGFQDASKDKDGYFGLLTRRALVLFQEKNGLDPDGVASIGTLTKLFKDDPNVEIQP